MTMWPTVPSDVITHVKSAFAEANRKVTESVLNSPNIRETALDDILIISLIPFSPPTKLPSGTTVVMQIHNVGGLRQYEHWEVADISILVDIFEGRHLRAQKVAFLQSKRLFPKNMDIEEDDPVFFAYGLNAMIARGRKMPMLNLHRRFEFDDKCLYGSIKRGEKQIEQIDKFNATFGDAVDYLLYGPPSLPCTIKFPLSSLQSVSGTVPFGSRVFSAHDVHDPVKNLPNDGMSLSPSLLAVGQTSDWPLEDWASDLLLTCKVGRQYDENDDEIISRVIRRRSGPIGAAISISIGLPGD